MARYRPNDKISVTVDPTKDDGSSASESDDEHRQLRTLVTTKQTSSTPSARPAGPTVVEQVIDGFDEDGLRGPTAVASVVQGDRGRVTSGAQRGVRTASLRSSSRLAGREIAREEPCDRSVG